MPICDKKHSQVFVGLLQSSTHSTLYQEDTTIQKEIEWHSGITEILTEKGGGWERFSHNLMALPYKLFLTLRENVFYTLRTGLSPLLQM